jgi:MFS family permease
MFNTTCRPRVPPRVTPVRPVVTDAVVDDALLADVLTPGRGLVLERPADAGCFEAIEGPFHAYRRCVTVTPAADGRHHVHQVVEGDLAIPYWGWLFRGVFRRSLGRLGAGASGQLPWWAPPDRLDARAAVALASLALLSAVLGYATILLTQTITFAADQFGATKAAQGVALASVRFDVLLSFPLVALTDRRGRRAVLLFTTALACVITAVGAVAPSLVLLIVTQVPARGMLTAAAVIVGIMVAEEMPAGGRAYALSLITMATVFGAGFCVVLLPVADIGLGGWRILFGLSLLGLLPMRSLARHLTESRRFRTPHPDAEFKGHGRRLWLLAGSAFLLAVFFTPASQFLNEFLRDERGFSGSRIALYTVLTSIPGAIGIVVGGRLADVHGRRGIGAVALTVGAGATVAMFAVTGWPMWAWSTAATIVGAATVPALGVYGPELFPTGLRGRANATLGVLGRLGSVVGLVVVGVVSSHHGFGPAMAIVATGPLVLAILVVTLYPETAHRALEELNPEDAEGAGE